MAIATLLTEPRGPGQDATFSFEHAMAHRELTGGMATAVEVFDPLTGTAFILPGTTGLAGFSALPYGPLDPQLHASLWHLDHGQAHSDAQQRLPDFFGFTSFGRMNPAPNFVDFNLQRPGHRTWWTFANHHDHLTAQSVLPQELVFPFW